MNIPNDLLFRASPYAGTQSRQAAGEGEPSSAFGKYLDVERQRQKMRELPPGQMLESVYLQFMSDYREWKARRTEEELPESKGRTEENLAFLRERYAGDDLSAYEIYDALDAMKKMGIISEKAANCAAGSYMVRVDLKSGIYQTNADPDSRGAWLHGFDEAPMIGFHSLDDMLSWAEEFREEDHPDFITHAEALARGWV